MATRTKKVTHGTWFDIMMALVARLVFPQVVNRALLYGPPGTGKSTVGSRLFPGVQIERVTLHQQLPPDDLIGTMGLVATKEGGTQTVWQDGPAVRAMRAGTPLVLDEIDQRSPEVESALHSICDDMEIACVTLPTGERVTPKPGFCVIATTNATPDTLPEALRNRFEVVLLANVPANGILARLPNGVASVVGNHYDTIAKGVKEWRPAISVRSAMAAVRIGAVVGEAEGFELVFGSAGVDILALAATHEAKKSS